jgi:hypothetical protein
VASVGLAKIAIAFAVGVALTLGGVELYQRLAPHATTPEPAAAAATPIGIDKLPDDDAKPATPAPVPPPTAPAVQKAIVKKPAKPHIAQAHIAVHRTQVQASKAVTATIPDPPLEVAQVEAPAPNPNPAPEPVNQTAPPAAPAPPPRQPRTVTIPAGTSLLIRLNQTLSSDHNFAGDTFQGALESPIILDSALVAEHGSKVVGKVVSVKRGGRGDAGSALSITLTQISTTDGQHIQVETSEYDQRTNRDSGKDAAKVGGGAALGAIIGAIAGGGKGAAIGAGVGGAAGGGDVLYTRGRPAVLQPEARISFQTTAPITITERINNP